MAKASKTEIFDAPISKVYKAIADFPAYTQFVDGMKAVEVHSSSPSSADVTFTLNIIKQISYRLNLKMDENKSVTWTLNSGDMMKINNGSWQLKDLGDGKTEVTYSVEVELKGFIPGLGMIEKTLVSTNLPMTLSAFQKRAKSL